MLKFIQLCLLCTRKKKEWYNFFLVNKQNNHLFLLEMSANPFRRTQVSMFQFPPKNVLEKKEEEEEEEIILPLQQNSQKQIPKPVSFGQINRSGVPAPAIPKEPQQPVVVVPKKEENDGVTVAGVALQLIQKRLQMDQLDEAEKIASTFEPDLQTTKEGREVLQLLRVTKDILRDSGANSNQTTFRCAEEREQAKKVLQGAKSLASMKLDETIRTNLVRWFISPIKSLQEQKQSLELRQESKIINPALSRNPYLLLYGPPGTGKTSIARALCVDMQTQLQKMNPNAKVYFFVVDAAKLKGVYVGQTEKNIEELFRCTEAAADKDKNGSISVIFLDEVDALLPASKGGAASETASGIRTLFLQKMDGVNALKNTYIFTTTNYLSRLDGAFLSRMDKKIWVDAPITPAERRRIFLNQLKRFLMWEDDRSNTTEKHPLLEFKDRMIQKYKNRGIEETRFFNYYYDLKESEKLFEENDKHELTKMQRLYQYNWKAMMYDENERWIPLTKNENMPYGLISNETVEKIVLLTGPNDKGFNELKDLIGDQETKDRQELALKKESKGIYDWFIANQTKSLIFSKYGFTHRDFRSLVSEILNIANEDSKKVIPLREQNQGKEGERRHYIQIEHVLLAGKSITSSLGDGTEYIQSLKEKQATRSAGAVKPLSVKDAITSARKQCKLFDRAEVSKKSITMSFTQFMTLMNK